VAATGHVAARLTWVEPPPPERVDAVDGLLDRAAAALDRAVDVLRLQAEVDTDPLTGIANRRRGERALDDAVDRLERFGEPVSVVIVDLDRFKEVNDELGHPAGDALLRALADGLVSSVRAHDTAARIGGDEFLVVLPGCPTLAGWRLADRLRTVLGDVLAEVVAVPVSVSIGVSSAETAPVTREQLVASADRALYEAKQAGRDRVGHRVVDRDPVATGS
jgi:diguanylate cyclase (GGDEF)-like protein